MPKGIYKHTHMIGNKLRVGLTPPHKKFFSAQDIKVRVCFQCKKEKTISEFYRSNTRYYQRECKQCNTIRKGKWHKTENGKRSSANTKLKRRFGITIEQYEQLLQNYCKKCSICGSTTSDHGHRLAIDHDHRTGEIRGILCKSCNLGIAHFRDDPYLLEGAILYLRVQ